MTDLLVIDVDLLVIGVWSLELGLMCFFGALFLGLAIYLAPALVGHPPRSLIWDRLIVGILPPDAAELNWRWAQSRQPAQRDATD